MSIVSVIVGYADSIKDGRTKSDIFGYLVDEVDELREEVNADQPGDDGIFGEAVDVLVNIIDLIRHEYPNATIAEIEAEIEAYALKKCEKWKRKAAC